MAVEAPQEEEQLSESELKKRAQDEEDRRYKETEIKYGIRYKMIAVFSVIILAIAVGITIIATKNQTTSLKVEKETQGKIIVRGLTAAIKARLVDIYGDSARKLAKMSTREDFRKWYKKKDISGEIFEDIDAVKNQPGVVYAYILGEQTLLLGHTDSQKEAYSAYKFEAGTASYFDLYKTRKEQGEMNKPEPIPVEIKFPVYKKDANGKRTKGPDGKDIIEGTKEVMDFVYLMSFKDKPTLKDAIGEVHIGIDLDGVKQAIFDSQVQLQTVGVIAIVVGILIAIGFATLLSGPMRRMIEGMRMVAEGNFGASVVVKSKDEVGLMSRTFNTMLKGMSILVSPEVAQVVLKGADLTKSGERKVVTVMFSDIRSFTTISEKLTPKEVVHMLNDYLEIMTDIIIKYGGVVDKFVGDEIFAVFGAPFDHPMHPLCACATAIEMGVELDRHNAEREQEEKPPIRIGIGVNTGEVIAGAMGSTKRVDYTSIGDAVNLGARLEGTNKVYGTLSICSEFTYAEVGDDVVVRELDLIRVKGKNEPVKIFEVLGLTVSGQKKIDEYLAQLKAEKEARLTEAAV